MQKSKTRKSSSRTSKSLPIKTLKNLKSSSVISSSFADLPKKLKKLNFKAGKFNVSGIALIEVVVLGAAASIVLNRFSHKGNIAKKGADLLSKKFNRTETGSDNFRQPGISATNFQ